MTQDAGRLVLTNEDRHSAVWQKIKEHYGPKLERLRARNDADMKESETQRLRGRIQEIKALLDIDLPREAVADEPPEY